MNFRLLDISLESRGHLGMIPLSNHDSSEVTVKSLSGWWYTYPSEKCSSVGIIISIYGKTNVPNHQPVIVYYKIL
jgi:hypothetical protein